MNKNIIFYTLKISAAAIVAIVVAMALKLEFAISAGIVAILTIGPTKKETIKTAMGRMVAFVAGLAIAFVCFTVGGYNVISYCVYLIIFILLCQKFKWYSAMAMNSVLISHFLTLGNMQWQSLINELLIFVIGVGTGVVANLHLHKNEDYMEELKDITDNQIKKILVRMSERILNMDMSDYNGDCFKVLGNSIRNAKNQAEMNYNNQFGNDDLYDIKYISMRDEQCHILYEMYKNVRSLHTTPITARIISDFLKKVANEYDEENACVNLMEEFKRIDESMKIQPLPKDRKEFEDRARLYSLLRYMEEFLNIKMEFAREQSL